MNRLAALLWLILVLVAISYLSLRVHEGLNFRTDLMALLPHEEQDRSFKQADDIATKNLSSRVIFLIGDKDKTTARKAAVAFSDQLTNSGLFKITTDSFNKDPFKRIGTYYYPYRLGLLSDRDRALLQSNQGQTLAKQALAQIYGVVGFANEKLLHADPFLLMPRFLEDLPTPLSRVTLDDGMLSLTAEGMTWILVAGQIEGEPYDLDTQKKVSALYDHAVQSQHTLYPDLETLHLGAVFFATAGAQEAMGETSIIGVLSTFGTILLVLLVFRALRPLFLSLLVILVGVVSALAVSLLIFGELHVGALLFGISLIGVSVDYSLQYCSEVFLPHPGTPYQRLKRVFIGITLGATTTIIGYLTLCLAPFPGLHQIAAFSAVGLLASWITVVLWLPLLDQKEPRSHGQSLLEPMQKVLTFWEASTYRTQRIALFVVSILVAALGFWSFHTDDNVRHMQSLTASLVIEQEKIQQLTGTTTSGQFFLVQAADHETALQNEETLIERLRPLVSSGELGGFQAPAQYFPSLKRQQENRLLQQNNLYKPFLTQQRHQLHLTAATVSPPYESPFLNLKDKSTLSPLPAFMTSLLLDTQDGTVYHMVMLDAVIHPEVIAQAAKDIKGIRFVDPAYDFSNLLAKYRNRSMVLLALSALFMIPLLIARYGIHKGLWVMAPPLFAVILTPALRSLVGSSFTFFDAMALVLVFSIGVDYAVFCAETSEERKQVTLLAVTMAACTALLSFGLLALSKVTAVHTFGATMTIGILLSYLFSPLARFSSQEHAKPILKSLFAVLCLFLLCSCISPPFNEPAQNRAATASVAVAPNVNLTLPNPATLNQSVEVTQLITAHYGDKVFAFEAHISANSDHFLLIALDMMGRKLFTLHWTKDQILYDPAPWVPSQLQPENILGDIVLLYWPEKIVRQSLAPSTVTFVGNSHHRTLFIDHKSIWQASYHLKNKSNPWIGDIQYSNQAWGYDFKVQSKETNP